MSGESSGLTADGRRMNSGLSVPPRAPVFNPRYGRLGVFIRGLPCLPAPIPPYPDRAKSPASYSANFNLSLIGRIGHRRSRWSSAVWKCRCADGATPASRDRLHRSNGCALLPKDSGSALPNTAFNVVLGLPLMIDRQAQSMSCENRRAGHSCASLSGCGAGCGP
jgi:hypothetical protein